MFVGNPSRSVYYLKHSQHLFKIQILNMIRQPAKIVILFLYYQKKKEIIFSQSRLGDTESVMCDITEIRLKRENIVKVGKETPKKRNQFRHIFLTLHMSFFIYYQKQCI